MLYYISAPEVLVRLDQRRTHIAIHSENGPILAVATITEAIRALTNNGRLFVGCVDRKGFVRRLETPARGIKVLRMLGRLKIHNGPVPGAEDNKTSFLNGKTWAHHAAHCGAFGRGKIALDAGCL